MKLCTNCKIKEKDNNFWLCSDCRKQYNKNYQKTNRERLLIIQKKNRQSRHPLYKIWDGMKQRCYNSNNLDYSRYGGRGIIVCDRWKNSFKNFFSDLLPQYKPGLTLDRINNNGNYEPGNVRWVTRLVQANNTRSKMEYKLNIPDNSPIYYPFDNLITLIEFSELTDIPLIVVKYRYAQHPTAVDWIIHDDSDNRYYKWRNHRYNMTELMLISGINYNTLKKRIVILKWPISKAINL